MRSKEQENILIKAITRKIKKLAEIEKKQSMNDLESNDSEFKINRKVFACVDGFIIYRTFSRENEDSFELITSSHRVGIIVKNSLPIKSNDGQLLNLFKFINPVIRLNWGIGTKLDIGSKGGGISINDIKIDGFQIMIFNYKDIENFKDTIDDIEYIIYSDSEIQKLNAENDELKLIIQQFNITNEPLILTEGKTDWKHFINALRYFHKKEQFKAIEEKWFLKFGSNEDLLKNNCDTSFVFESSVSKLNKLTDSFIEARNIDSNISKAIRICIYDSDDKQAKPVSDKKNKVYSFLIKPNDISTEFLYSNSEIQTTINDRRLYIGTEFYTKTKKLINNLSVNLGGDNSVLNKAGKNIIIDSDVYDETGSNISLTKEMFAQQVYNGYIIISDESYSNFKFIFERILEHIME